MAILAISQRVVTTLIDISYVASDLVLRPIGWVESPVTDPSVTSRQGDEGARRPAPAGQALEAIDGTPIVDIKHVLEPRGER
jgi:tRNA (Thr-GGU) A37 N-methylase